MSTTSDSTSSTLSDSRVWALTKKRQYSPLEVSVQALDLVKEDINSVISSALRTIPSPLLFLNFLL